MIYKIKNVWLRRVALIALIMPATIALILSRAFDAINYLLQYADRAWG